MFYQVMHDAVQIKFEKNLRNDVIETIYLKLVYIIKRIFALKLIFLMLQICCIYIFNQEVNGLTRKSQEIFFGYVSHWSKSS